MASKADGVEIANSHPFAALLNVQVDDPDMLREVGPLVEAAAMAMTGVTGIESTYEPTSIAIRLLCAPDADPDLIFLTARAGSLAIAGTLEGRARLTILEARADGSLGHAYAINPSAVPTELAPTDMIGKLVEGLQRSSSRLAEGVSAVLTKAKLDTQTLDDLEELLITADLGAPASARIRAALSKERFGKDITTQKVKEALAAEIAAILSPFETTHSPFEGPGPRVILFVGVNGSGKTTTIGKIAYNLSAAGHKVMLAAGDTFRAAAVEQLKVWGERCNVPVVARETGLDAAGLAYEAFERAKAERMDVLLIDTAGRLSNKTELMSELAKIVRVIGKVDPLAPHETWLVLDATVGQNAIAQTEAFRHAAGITGLVMTKLDGTAKGGVLVAVTDRHKLPIRFIGVGEHADDLQPFSAHAFAHALVGLRTL
ncbi:signal recognition particle-docking protein FtsY [Candidatus Phycosocius spiralis]|nr:signal recognition particle-docking protein FtsY [Candidatus Phycosocius spiralis]